jgi:hypothetical protein
MAAFTTVAAGIGLATTAATTGMSFSNAGKQRRKMREAETAADKAMQEARQKLEVNVFDKLAIQKEPYELQREAMLSQGAQAIQAGVESERGGAATAGRVQMAANEGQAAIRTAMGQDLQQLEMLSAQEEGRLRDIGVQLDLEEVAGAQLAAANAQELGAQATAQGFEGLTSLGGQLAENAPLFEQNRGAQQAALGELNLTAEQTQNFGNIKGRGKTPDQALDLKAISQMNAKDFGQFKRRLTPAQKQALFMNKQFTDSYNKFAPFTSLSN